jgi:hypothetical protein
MHLLSFGSLCRDKRCIITNALASGSAIVWASQILLLEAAVRTGAAMYPTIEQDSLQGAPTGKAHPRALREKLRGALIARLI